MPFDAEITTKSRDLIVLEKARARIAQGWCQKVRHSVDGGVCIVGAVQDAAGIPEDSNAGVYTATLPWLSYLGFDADRPADFWNDAPKRTQAEVLARFDAAIARLSQEQEAAA